MLLIPFLLGSCSNNQISPVSERKACLWPLILDHASTCQGRGEVKWSWKYLMRQPGNLSGIFPALLCSLCPGFLQSPGQLWLSLFFLSWVLLQNLCKLCSKWQLESGCSSFHWFSQNYSLTSGAWLGHFPKQSGIDLEMIRTLLKLCCRKCWECIQSSCCASRHALRLFEILHHK